MDRTRRGRLHPTPEQAGLLAETARQCTAVCNAVAAHGYTAGEKNGVTLHHALDRPRKVASPALVSDHHLQARVKATAAIKSALARAKQGCKVSAPHSPACPPRYNVHTFKVEWAARTVRLSTTEGRITVPFAVPAYAGGLAGGTVCTADLIRRDGHWWLHIVVDLPAPEVAPTAEVVGVDLGVAQPAVTSAGKFLGRKAWRNTEARYFKHRRALQARGSKRARRRLRKLRGRQARFRRPRCDDCGREPDQYPRPRESPPGQASAAHPRLVVRPVPWLHRVQSRGPRLYGGWGGPAPHQPGLPALWAHRAQQSSDPRPVCLSFVRLRAA